MYPDLDPTRSKNVDFAKNTEFRPGEVYEHGLTVETANLGSKATIFEGSQKREPILVNSAQSDVFSDILMIEPISTV